MDTGKLKIYVSLAVLFFFLSCTQTPTKDDMKTYTIGYMICNSEQETLQRFKPFTVYLSKKLGVQFEAMAIDTSDFTKHVDELDFTHTNSLLYVIMNRNNGVEILAAEKSGSLGARVKGLIIASKKSGLKSVQELKGKTMIFGPALGPTSYMAQLDILIKNGVDPENDLAYYSIPAGSFKHERVIYGVLFGKYDAGAAPLLDYERMIADGRIDPDDFTVLAEGEPVPYCNFAVTQKVPEDFAKRFREVLLNIKKDDTVSLDGEVIKVLERAHIDGYEDVKDRDFDSIRDMAKRTNMPPYQRY